MKRLIAILSCVALCCGLLGGCAGTPTEEPPKQYTPTGNGTGLLTSVKVVPATEKIKREDDPQIYSESVEISCAQNEYESAQIIVNAKEKIDDLYVTVSDLKSGSNTVSSQNISVYWEHYIFFKQKDIQNPNVTGLTEGYYPDALVPLNLRREKKESQVEKGQNQGIWITVKTEENTPAGNYAGKITLFADGKEEKTQIDFNLEVYDFALPKANHGQTAFAIWDLGAPTANMLHLGYGDDADFETISENYYEFLLDYRISPTWISNQSMLSFEERMQSYLTNLEREEVASLALPYTLTAADVNFENFEKVLTRLADYVLAKQKPELIDKTYAYFTVIDEPASADSYAKVKKHCKSFQDVVKKVAAEKFSANDQSVYREKFEDLRLLVTTHYAEDKVKAGIVNGEGTNENDGSGIDTWCPTFDWFDSEEYRGFMEVRKEAGDHVWFYGCVLPRAPYPNLHIPDLLLPQRVLPWMQFEYGVEGQLYWCVNNYGIYSDEEHKYVGRDVWTDGMSWKDAGGDGMIVYPGAKYGLKSPIPTIRLDNLRAGQEDYEWLYLLRTLYEEAGEPCGVDFNGYVSNLYKQLYQGTQSRNDSAVYAAVKKELADLIVLAKKGVFVYASTDQNNACKVQVASQTAPSSVTLNGKAMTQSGGKYEGTFSVSGSALAADVEITLDGKVYRVSRFTGGRYEQIEGFENENVLPRVSVTEGNYTVSKSLAQGKNGTALKISCGAAARTGTFRVTLNGSYDFTRSEKLIADLYNDSDAAHTVKIVFRDSNRKTAVAYEAYLLPKQWNHVDTLLRNGDLRNIDLANVQDIYFTISVKEGEKAFSLLFDNLAFTELGGASEEEPTEPNAVAKWSFGTTQDFTFAQYKGDADVDGMKVVSSTDCANGKALKVTVGANSMVSFLAGDNRADGAKFLKMRVYSERGGNYALKVQEMNGNWEQLLGNDGAMFTLKRGWNEYRLEFTRTLDCALNNFVFISKDNVASEFLVDSFIFTETAEGTLESSELANMPAGNTVAVWNMGTTEGFTFEGRSYPTDTAVADMQGATGGKAAKVVIGAETDSYAGFLCNDNVAFGATKMKLRIYAEQAATVMLKVDYYGGGWTQLLGDDGKEIALQAGWNEYELTLSEKVNYKFNQFVFRAKDQTQSVEFYLDTVTFEL